MEEKCCRICNYTKTLPHFCRNPRSRDGLQNICRECMSARHGKASPSFSFYLRSPNGTDQETRDLMLRKQHGRCYICGLKTKLVVDHDHQLEEYGPLAIRGLLCFKCNSGLGMFEDNIERLQSAIRYLQRFQLKPFDGG